MQVCRETLRKVRLVDHMCQNLIFSFSSDASRSYCCRGRDRGFGRGCCCCGIGLQLHPQIGLVLTLLGFRHRENLFLSDFQEPLLLGFP